MIVVDLDKSPVRILESDSPFPNVGDSRLMASIGTSKSGFAESMKRWAVYNVSQQIVESHAKSFPPCYCWLVRFGIGLYRKGNHANPFLCYCVCVDKLQPPFRGRFA